MCVCVHNQLCSSHIHNIVWCRACTELVRMYTSACRKQALWLFSSTCIARYFIMVRELIVKASVSILPAF